MGEKVGFITPKIDFFFIGDLMLREKDGDGSVGGGMGEINVWRAGRGRGKG